MMVSRWVEGYVLSLGAMCLLGSTGTLMKLGQASWSMWFGWMEVGLGLAAASGVAWTGSWTATATYVTESAASELAWPVAASASFTVGLMLFFAAIDLMGLVAAVPVCMGLETALGTALLYSYEPGENEAGLVFLALSLMTAAIASDVLAQYQLTMDEGARFEVVDRDGVAQALVEAQPPLNPLILSQLLTETADSHGLGSPDFRRADAEALRLVFPEDSAAADHSQTDETSRFDVARKPLLGVQTKDGRSYDSQNFAGEDGVVSAAGVVEEDTWFDRGEHHWAAVVARVSLIRAAVGGAPLERLTNSKLVAVDPRLTKDLDSTTAQVSPRPKPGQKPGFDQALLEAKARQALGMGIWRAVLGGCLLALPPFFETVAVSRDPDLKVVTFLAVFAAVSVLTFVVALPVRALYLRRAGSRSRRRHFSYPAALAEPRAAVSGVTGGFCFFYAYFAMYQAGTFIGNTTAVTIARCAAVVAVLWGVFFWLEAQHASPRAAFLIALTVLAYASAILCIYLSALFAPRD